MLTGKGEKTRRLKIYDILFQSLARWLGAAGLVMEGAGALFRSFDRVTSNSIDASNISQLVAA